MRIHFEKRTGGLAISYRFVSLDQKTRKLLDISNIYQYSQLTKQLTHMTTISLLLFVFSVVSIILRP